MEKKINKLFYLTNNKLLTKIKQFLENAKFAALQITRNFDEYIQKMTYNTEVSSGRGLHYKVTQTNHNIESQTLANFHGKSHEEILKGYSNKNKIDKNHWKKPKKFNKAEFFSPKNNPPKDNPPDICFIILFFVLFSDNSELLECIMSPIANRTLIKNLISYIQNKIYEIKTTIEFKWKLYSGNNWSKKIIIEEDIIAGKEIKPLLNKLKIKIDEKYYNDLFIRVLIRNKHEMIIFNGYDNKIATYYIKEKREYKRIFLANEKATRRENKKSY